MACSGKRKHLAAAVFWAKWKCGFQANYSPSKQLYIYRREKPSVLAEKVRLGETPVFVTKVTWDRSYTRNVRPD